MWLPAPLLTVPLRTVSHTQLIPTLPKLCSLIQPLPLDIISSAPKCLSSHLPDPSVVSNVLLSRRALENTFGHEAPSRVQNRYLRPKLQYISCTRACWEKQQTGVKPAWNCSTLPSLGLWALDKGLYSQDLSFLLDKMGAKLQPHKAAMKSKDVENVCICIHTYTYTYTYLYGTLPTPMLYLIFSLFCSEFKSTTSCSFL